MIWPIDYPDWELSAENYHLKHPILPKNKMGIKKWKTIIIHDIGPTKHVLNFKIYNFDETK